MTLPKVFSLIIIIKKMVFYFVTVVLFCQLVLGEGDTCTRYGFDVDLPGVSCADIYNKNPTSHDRTGHYVLKTNQLVFALCDMKLECGGIKGGWMRIADIHTNRKDDCPSGWIKNDNHSYCTGDKSAGCYSTHFPTLSTSYSKVCGKVVGYQKGSMDGFYPSAHAQGRVTEKYKPIMSSRSLDGVYVDGISITSGNPRKHVWTYAVGLSDDENYSNLNCPCAKHPGPDPPAYVGNHYYCESGNTGAFDKNIVYINDTLWDGAGCEPDNSCCYNAGMPWFFRQFPTAVHGDIEVRICHDQTYADEGVAVEQIQLYVQ